VERALANITAMTAGVDNSYIAMVREQTSSNQEPPSTCLDCANLILDEGCPWETQQFNGIKQECFRLQTSSFRGLWLSTGLSQIHRIIPEITENGAIQLLALMSWQNSFQRFHEVLSRMVFRSDHHRKYPIYLYEEIAKTMFHDEESQSDNGHHMIGGDDPRYSPMGMDFRKMFGDHRNHREGTVDKLVSQLVSMAEDFNKLEDASHDVVVETYQKRNQCIREVLGNCELGVFRLAVCLQGMAHLGVILRPRKLVREFFVPMRESGSWEHLRELTIDEKDIPQVIEEIKRELNIEGRHVAGDQVETLLCESKPGRLLEKRDLFVKGQSLFRLCPDGIPLVKRYGSKKWEPVGHQTHNWWQQGNGVNRETGASPKRRGFVDWVCSVATWSD